MKLTFLQASQTVAEMIENSDLRLTDYHKHKLAQYKEGKINDSEYFEFDNFLFGGGCSLRIPPLSGKGIFGEIENKIEVNWSSCRKSISQAAATVAHYQKVVALAAQIQAFLEEVEIEG